jgi:aldose 1-epimerase
MRNRNVTPVRSLLLIAALSATAASGQNYRAEQTIDHGVQIVRLTDTASAVEVSIVPSIGNRAYEMKVHGENILYFPYSDVSEFQKRPRLCGIPFSRHGQTS